MKKTLAIILAAASLAVCAPALSGCGGGVKFTLSEEGGKHYIVSFSGMSSASGEYEIPETYGDENIPVTEIAEEGFSGTGFSKITIPKTVTKIGNMAFGYCRALKEVEFAEGIQIEKLSQSIFANCGKLQQIKIPDSVKTLEAYAFTDCKALSAVEMGPVESIGYGAFANCSALGEISLPDTLTTIGNSAFYCCGFEEIEIPDSVHDTVIKDTDGNESTVYGLGYAAFEGCSNLKTVKIGSGIKTVPAAAFGACTSLKDIYVPLSVEEIGGAYYKNASIVFGHAFYNCTALTNIYYAGNEEQWKSIKIDYSRYSSSVNNEAIKNAVKHYNSEL